MPIQYVQACYTIREALREITATIPTDTLCSIQAIQEIWYRLTDFLTETIAAISFEYTMVQVWAEIFFGQEIHPLE